MTITRKILTLCAIFGTFMACSNNPYPDESTAGNVFYAYTTSPPKNLDPQHTYTMVDLGFLKLCYDPLVDYGYLDQQTLRPALAKTVPKAKIKKDANGKILEVRYSFNLREGAHYIDDDCFPEGKGREITAQDFEYAFKRAADKEVNCPIFTQLAYVKGYQDYRDRVDKLRKEIISSEFKGNFDKDEDYIPSKELYEKAGKLEGIEITGKYSFDMVLSKKYPQMLYWLAMRFICAVPYEAVDYYNPTKKMNSRVPVNFNLRPVGSGPYRILWEEFRIDQKVIMVKNENWWGNKIKSPTTRFPDKPHSKEDEEKGYWTQKAAGKSIAQMDRIEWHVEKESLTSFSKFMQGYFDINFVPPQKAGEVIAGQDLSPDMKKMGIKMNRSVEMAIRYIGFNMKDDTVGAPDTFSDESLESEKEKSLTRNRKLRQSLSLAVDMDEYIRVHLKGLAMNAQSPLPPGVYGYTEEYQHPYKYKNTESLDKARKLLEEAGYKNGIDPSTGEALKLEFTVAIRGPEDTARFNYFIDCWKKIGLNVKLDGLEYNQFQNKVYGESFQIFMWGWHADYPDPENFLFLLASENAPTPNKTHFSNSEYDKYFKALETLENDESAELEVEDSGQKVTKTFTRMELLTKCKNIIAKESPWIILYHDIQFLLYHSWMENVKSHPLFTFPFHFYRLDSKPRTIARKEWNKPLYWPAFMILIMIALFTYPAFKTYIKERN